MDGLYKNPSKHRPSPTKVTRRPAILNESQNTQEIPLTNDACGLISVTHELDQGSCLLLFLICCFKTSEVYGPNFNRMMKSHIEFRLVHVT